MALTQGWQVAWETVTITTNGSPVTHYRDEILPATTDAGELAQRAALVTGGALRLVQVATTPTDTEAAVYADATAAEAAETSELAAETGTPVTGSPVPSIDTPGGIIADTASG